MERDINEDNWHLYTFSTEKLSAFISVGADLDQKVVYYVTVTDRTLEKEIFQEICATEQEALELINSKYGTWPLIMKQPLQHCPKA